MLKSSSNRYKTLLNYLLNRINTVTGKRYGDDPSILAWQTGNELQHSYKGARPPPGHWTGQQILSDSPSAHMENILTIIATPAEIASHIKSLAPHTLVMDGSFAKDDRIEECYAREALKSKDVDIIDYHYYGSKSCYRDELRSELTIRKQLVTRLVLQKKLLSRRSMERRKCCFSKLR